MTLSGIIFNDHLIDTHMLFAIGAPYNWICISSRLRDIEPETYWGHNTRYVIDDWSRDDLIPHMLFPIGAPLKPSPYLQALESYSTPQTFSSQYISVEITFTIIVTVWTTAVWLTVNSDGDSTDM